MSKHESKTLTELIEQLMVYLQEEGYAKATWEKTEGSYRVLERYAETHGITHFDFEIGKEFLLNHYNHRWNDSDVITGRQSYLQRLILMLHEFQEHGEVVSKKRATRFYHLPHFENVINDFLNEERENGMMESTIARKQHVLRHICEYFESVGLCDTKAITPENIYGFLAFKSSHSVSTKEKYQYLLRLFIKYLHKEGLCKDELLRLFPVVSVHRKNAYPSYFKPNDIAKILRCVDTDAPSGKRDYLVLLLASCLGIRCGDIRQLKLKNINWNGRKMEFVQSKTGESINFSLSDEIFYALIDYVKNERPDCGYDELFVSNTAPVRPFTNGAFYKILQKHLAAADISIEECQKHGLHAMRSSLASNMLRDGVSPVIISNVLGHKYSDTTTAHYIKIDLDGLRKSALEVPVL